MQLRVGVMFPVIQRDRGSVIVGKTVGNVSLGLIDSVITNLRGVVD